MSPGLYNWTAGSTARYPMLAPVIRVGGTPIPQTLGDTFAVGTTLEQATNTVAAYTNAHPGTTAASFGNVMCLAEAMGFRFADLAIGSNILNFNPGVTLTGFRPAPWTLTFRVGNGIDATAVLAMNRLAGSAAKELTVIGRPEPDGSETGFVPAVQYGADGTATAVFGPPGMSATGFFRLQLEHASPPP